MQRVVNASEQLADKQLVKMINFAVSVRDNEDASDRDRMRAVELLNAMIAKGVDVAQYIDKLDRIDSGKPTERTEVTLKVTFDE
jgi:hypothetical protein